MRQDCYDVDSTMKSEKVELIPIIDIEDFPNHPFRVNIDKDMMELAESINRIGVTTPAIVRQNREGGYQIIAGHRRKTASEIAGKKLLPCIVKELSDEDSIIFLVDSNIHRVDMLPSEKAYAYKMRLDAMKRKAGRPKKDNYVPVAHNLKGKTSRKYLSELTGESEDQIRRYIRLTELIPPILKMVDEKKISLRPAVELSYLSVKDQALLVDIMECYACTPSHAQAIRIRQLCEVKEFDYEVIKDIMAELKGNQKEKLNISKEKIKGFFPPKTSEKIMEKTIIVALEYYYINVKMG